MYQVKNRTQATIARAGNWHPLETTWPGSAHVVNTSNGHKRELRTQTDYGSKILLVEFCTFFDESVGDSQAIYTLSAISVS